LCFLQRPIGPHHYYNGKVNACKFPAKTGEPDWLAGDVEPQIENRGAVGDPAGGDEIHADGGDLGGGRGLVRQQTYGRIDLLFNNAGISTRGIPFEELTWEQWSNVVAVSSQVPNSGNIGARDTSRRISHRRCRYRVGLVGMKHRQDGPEVDFRY
jgi:hypothetical protein